MKIAYNMKHLLLVLLLTGMILAGCSSNENVGRHLGERRLASDIDIQYDSIVISADSTSLRGNFVMMDSSLVFVDQLYCRIYAFSLADGSLIKTYSGHGQGPNEMNGIMYGSVIHPADTLMLIFDSSYGVYEFTPSNGNVRYRERLNFSWEKPKRNDYSSPSCYGVMEMSDFGLTMYQIDDSTILIPVSLINRNFDKITSERYKSGHILGKANVKSYEITTLTGQFPEFYASNPLPYFEFFDYTIDFSNSRIYASHAPDSLIYCYDYEGNLINTIGYEPAGINRNYTKGFNTSSEIFKKDLSQVGVNTGLYFDENNGLLFRTSMTDFVSGKTIMQIYRENNLVFEKAMPSYLKILGRQGDSYYGVRFLPVDDGNNSTFVLYRISLKMV